MNKSLRAITYFFVAIGCINTGQQESTTGKEKPQINFKGTLIDTSAQTMAVENITISGIYKNIPFYANPAEAEDVSPEDNVTLISLVDVETLKSVPQNGHKVTFKGRPYNKVVVKLRNQPEAIYLVEASRRIFCDIPLNKHSIEKRLSFDALKELTITSYQQHEEKALQAETQPKSATGHERECAQAGKALDQLNEAAQNVSGPQKNVILELIDSLRNWVGGICGTSAA